MAVRIATVAFEGIEARPVDVQVQLSAGNVVFNVVGLGDKAVALRLVSRRREPRSTLPPRSVPALPTNASTWAAHASSVMQRSLRNALIDGHSAEPPRRLS
jgi:hypothetical protein